MREHTITIDIAAPPERVWAVMSDVERWHEWTASVSSVKLRDGGPIAPGSVASVRQPKLPPAKWTVTSVTPNREFTWVSVAPGVRVTGTHQVEATATGSRATLGLTYKGALAWLLEASTRAITLRYVNLEAEGLKRRSEAGA